MSSVVGVAGLAGMTIAGSGEVWDSDVALLLYVSF